MKSESILFVDDEPNVLSAFERRLRSRYHLQTSTEPEKALEMVAKGGPYAVVVSDLRMPGMNGIELLSRVRNLSPDTVRVMLTGYADLEAAIKAVNQGNVFRFLTKPCSGEDLEKAIEDSLRQYRLVRAEKELLEKTLKGIIRVLTELLGLLKPEVFERATRLAKLSGKVARLMGADDLWKIETAALLSQIGMVSLPDELMRKLQAEEELAPEERRLFERHPFIASNLIAHIPRLGDVAEIVSLQEKRFDGSGFPEGPLEGEDIPIGARILKACLDFDTLQVRGMSAEEALENMRGRKGWYDPAVLAALDGVVHAQGRYILRAVGIEGLSPGMILAEDVVGRDGTLLLAKGREVTKPIVERLLGVAQAYGLAEPIRVFIPVEMVIQGNARETLL